MNSDIASDRFLTLRQVQDLLAVSRTTVWRWTAEHGLKVVKIGDLVRIRESDLGLFLQQHVIGGDCKNTSSTATAGDQFV